MKLNKFIALAILSTSLCSCGIGPVTITGVTSNFYILNEDGKEALTPKEYIKEEDKKEYPCYEVMNSREYFIEILPTWRGSRVPAFDGDVATFSESDYWQIEFDEEASKSKNPFYCITFDYPVDTEIENQKLEYKVNGYINHIIVRLIPYHMTDINRYL